MKDIYVYPGTNILINLRDIKNQDDLDDFESAMVALALVKLQNEVIIVESIKDLLNIHKSMFLNVYDWAGETRKINKSRPELVLNDLSVEYEDYKSIPEELKKLNEQLLSIKWSTLDKTTFIKNLVLVISRLWQIHPFREGNTRTVTFFMYLHLKKYGFTLNQDFISIHAKYFRNALVLASIGEYSEYIHLESILLDSIDPNTEDLKDLEKYKTIKGYDLKNYKYNYHTEKSKK